MTPNIADQIIATLHARIDELVAHVETLHYEVDAIPAPPVEQAQSQPVATVQCVRGVTIGYLDVMQPVGTKLYTHPAQQVAVPMTEAQIFACDPVPHVMFDQQRIDFARAVEAFHGIGVKPVTKPDSRPQNCGTGHCSCIECPYPKADWSAA